MSSSREPERSPGWEILWDGEAAQAKDGHPDDGFLSRSHGLLPGPTLPLLRMPASHHAWDELAQELPPRFHAHRIRSALRELPPLSAKEDALPAAYLCRAALLLGAFARTWALEGQLRGRLEGGAAIPAAVMEPWGEVCRRLGRSGRGMTFQDLNVYNFRLRDPSRPSPVRIGNLEPLVPIVGNEEERVFYMGMLEMLDRARPLLPAMLRAQDATLQDDEPALVTALAEIADALDQVTYEAFLAIEVNPHADANVDPIVWSRTTAPIARPACEGDPGTSGAAAPIFHFLDAFFGRTAFRSELGVLIEANHPWDPPRYRALHAVLAEVSVRAWIVERGSSLARTAFQSALDAYAGPRGLLGIHRLKMYGFMELSFRTGRTITGGDFVGGVEQRSWEVLDREVDEARRERYEGLSIHPSLVRRPRVEPAAPAPGAAQRVGLELRGTGLRHRVGDRVAIYGRNRGALIERARVALGAPRGQPVALTHAWQAHLRQLLGGEVSDRIPIETFLAFAQLRPLSRAVGKALLAITSSPPLREVLDRGEEDAHELWEALELIGRGPYDLRRLWRAEPWSTESLARCVPPEQPRLYSISSAPGSGDSDGRLELTVAPLRYQDGQGDGQGDQPRERQGVVSTFLTEEPDDGPNEGERPVPLRIVHPSRFHLPGDPSRPLVMFAGGTGVSPFRGFLQARAVEPSRGAEPDRLYLGLRSPDHLLDREELAREVAAGRLELHVACSRAEPSDAEPFGHFVAGRVDRLIELDEPVLRSLLLRRAEGGRGACFYICGQSAFAATVLDGLESILSRVTGGVEAGHRALARLLAQRRLMLDIFTTFAPAMAPGLRGSRVIDASEVVLHNRPERGRWMILNGRVHDVGAFEDLHPGGPAILRLGAGLDATRSYENVEHHLNPEVNAMLDMYKIGRVRRLRLGSAWGWGATLRHGYEDTTGVEGLRLRVEVLTLEELYRRWVRYLYSVVELENTLLVTLDARERPFVRGERPELPPRSKLDFLLESHERLHERELPGLLGAPLEQLWLSTIGLCAPRERTDHLREALAAAMEHPTASAARRWSETWRQRLAAAPAEPLEPELDQECALALTLDLELLDALKCHVREGLLLFERHEARLLTEAADELCRVLSRLGPALRAHYQRFVERLGLGAHPTRQESMR